MQTQVFSPRNLTYFFRISVVGFVLSLLINFSTYFALDLPTNFMLVPMLGLGMGIGVWGALIWMVYCFVRRKPSPDYWKMFWGIKPLWMKLLFFVFVIYFFVGGFMWFYTPTLVEGRLSRQGSDCLLEKQGQIVRALSESECQQRSIADARAETNVDMLFYWFCVCVFNGLRVRPSELIYKNKIRRKPY
ncbi:MAG: hypothetical protein HY868_22815 [Chloroflexi bacterium]|nr:hypothetical protein [Chloroflexota bacterium]